MTAALRPFALVLGLALAHAPGPRLALAGGPVAPGAYCPLPKAGETPQCLEPAKDQYAEFFSALDGGEISEADVSRLERDVASGASAENRYLAISSLSYGYYRLAQAAAANPDEDPAIVARLQRWNELLSRAYGLSERDPAYRGAVRSAALDLQQHAPQVRVACADEHGRTAECDSTEALLRGLNRAEEEVGIRGALGRLLRRVMGGSGR